MNKSNEQNSSTNKSKYAVLVEGLYKSFGEFHVHKGIDLQIERGSITYVMGGSGVGKSVLLKQIMGFIQPDRGQVIVNGKNITEAQNKEARKIRHEMGILFQNGALFDSLSVFENVCFALREQMNLSNSELDGRVESLLKSVGLTFDHSKKMPAELSGGQRKRVALARAIAMKPSIMMYDEPTTGLDPLTTDMVTNLIRETNHKHNLTSIVISHDTNVALDVAEKLTFLKDGKVQYDGEPHGVFSATNPDVQEFFASEKKRLGLEGAKS